MITQIETITISQIVLGTRIRVDLGNIDELSDSIRQFGIIQPIVIERHTRILVAGGRRLTACKRLGWTELVHGRDFIWRDEESEHQRKAVELEENIKRKSLTWTEELEAKKALLEHLQAIHGVSYKKPTQADVASGADTGMSINKLSALLGESQATTSRDLQIADAISKFPALKKLDSKGAAFQKMKVFGTVLSVGLAALTKKTQEQKDEARISLETGLPIVHKAEEKFRLYEGDFRDNISKIPDQTIDLLHTDLPYGADIEKMSAHSSSGATAGNNNSWDSRDNIISLLPRIAQESYRILKSNAYAVFWFGFNYYAELMDALKSAGYTGSPVPVIWVKNTKSGENPLTRYSNSYEAAIVAVKGSPVMMRPGKGNIKVFPTVPPKDKTHVAEKPVELIKDIIQDLVPSGANIVDFFAGTGSTGVAAIGVSCFPILFEIDKTFCDIARAKLEVL